MKALVFSNYQFRKLKKYKLEKNISHVESELFVIQPNKNRNHESLMLKKFYNTEGEYFGNKLLTINSLINNKGIINIDRLIIPSMIAIIDKKVAGYVMPYIQNDNLYTILSSSAVPSDEKIDYLKQIGSILEQTHHIPSLQNKFFLTDIHEANFILEKETKKVFVTDLDSCKIANNQPSHSKYLALNDNLKDFQFKYPVDETGTHIPSVDTEIYCYICMILNTISKINITKLSIDEYYTYLQYLSDIGYPKELIECFSNLYIDRSNISPLPYLDLIPRPLGRAAYHVFAYQQQYQYKNKKLIKS